MEGAEALIQAGARVDVTNAAGETPLIAAVHRRDAGLMRMLLANGANPDRTDNSGRSARDYAALMQSNSQMMAEPFSTALIARKPNRPTIRAIKPCRCNVSFRRR